MCIIAKNKLFIKQKFLHKIVLKYKGQNGIIIVCLKALGPTSGCFQAGFASVISGNGVIYAPQKPIPCLWLLFTARSDKFYDIINFMEVMIMPNIKSAKKRVKVIAAKTLRNKMIKSNLKTVIKTADAEKSPEAIKLAIKKVDQACAKGIMHKNKAARKKSQLAKKLNAAQ